MATGDTVLVIEDENQAREFLLDILNFEGFKAIGFPDGAKALSYLRVAPPPCLILLDLLMPIMDGRQFRAALLQDSALAKVPVVIVTALDTSAAQGLSAVGILQKPVNIDTLLDLVRTHC